jgi:hypothetical protein
MVGEQTADLVRRALREGPFGLNGLATESELSYDVLRSWKSGRRRPSEAGIRRLAQGLERRAERLAVIARELNDSVSATAVETVP